MSTRIRAPRQRPERPQIHRRAHRRSMPAHANLRGCCHCSAGTHGVRRTSGIPGVHAGGMAFAAATPVVTGLRQGNLHLPQSRVRANGRCGRIWGMNHD